MNEKGFWRGLQLFLLILAVLIPLLASDVAGETIIRDLEGAKIIRSQEQPHNVLNDACIACHEKEKFDFWIVIYKGKPPALAVDLKEAGKTDAGEIPAASPKNRYNSHDSLSCSFCHFEKPSRSAPRFIVDIQELCRLCHPGTTMHRLPEGEDHKRIAEAILSGKLPGRDGGFLCTTCHRIHDSTYGMRDSYTQILWQGRIPDPHGKRTLCFTCHPEGVREGEEVKFSGDADNIRMCTECHLLPGVRKAPHVVDVPSSEGTWRMDYLGYPLRKGKLICSTCHDEVSHKEKEKAGRFFLRGGPYSSMDRFCERCHLDDKVQSDNPHRQLNAFGKIRNESCVVCHRHGPDPGKPDPGDNEMVADEMQLCVRCHAYRPHPEVDHMIPLSSEKDRRRVEYEKRHQVTLPLGKDGVIMCSTCHNPHAKGVLKGGAGVGAGSKWRVPDFREVCAPCHGRY